MVTIDIMMPFYGDVDLFKAAVSSVVAQSDPGWRLVVIDDRYPSDEPARFIAGLGDERVHYVLNDENLGVTGNFQRAIDLATANFVTIMGCDDVLLPRYVARVRELIALFPDAAYVQPGVEVIDAEGEVTAPLADRMKARYRPPRNVPAALAGEELATSLLRGNWTYFLSLCWQRRLLRIHGFRAEYRIVLDLALQLALVQSGGTLVVDDEPVFRYRRHESASSWSGSGLRRFQEEKSLFREWAVTAQSLGWERAAGAARHHFSSRLHAVMQLPCAVAARGVGFGGLLRHIFGS